MIHSWGLFYNFHEVRLVSSTNLHCFIVPFLFAFLVFRKKNTIAKEPLESSKWGLGILGFALFIFLISIRILQPRLGLFSLPFFIIGSSLYLLGFPKTRHLVIPAFFWLFAITVPGIEQATNYLQVAVTKLCYLAGTGLGMELTNAGTNIASASGKWHELEIAEGCSGIRSITALVLISAVYAYMTQKNWWKMGFLFACALPLALIANFLRIFTIIVLAECGFSHFAAGAYHDWAGLLFFFPIALSGLFLIDKLLNAKHQTKKQLRTRIQ